MIATQYSCSQAELYSACRLGWQSCEQHLSAFAAFKARYTATFVTDRLAEVNAAAALPDEQARGEATELYRVRLVAAADQCLATWQRLKRYVADAFPAAEQKARLEAAGWLHYERASQHNWDSVAALLQSAVNFIAANAAALAANQNMPAAFQAQCTALLTDFIATQTDFLNAKEEEAIGTADKISANNAVYQRLINMFLDGQEIFRDDEAVRKQFVFTEVLTKIGGAGTSGVSGGVTDGATGRPLEGVLVTVEGREKSALTNDLGRYEILQVAAGFYTIRAEKAGYQTLRQPNHEIRTGTVGRLDLVLQPAEVPVPA